MPLLLDAYCGAGGAGMGYRRAGFTVVGVDTHQYASGYPAGEFVRMDAPSFIRQYGHLFHVIHASPPCQAHTVARHLRGKRALRRDMMPATRDALQIAGRPYVIENVPGAPMRADLTLCGSSFGLGVRRHRLFESDVWLGENPACDHPAAPVVGVYSSIGSKAPGGGQVARSLDEGREAMGIDWMDWIGLVEAVPPAYTELIGRQLIVNQRVVGFEGPKRLNGQF